MLKKILYAEGRDKETSLSGLNSDSHQLFSGVYIFTSIQVSSLCPLLMDECLAWALPAYSNLWGHNTEPLCQKSCFFNALARTWASLIAAQAAWAQINDYSVQLLAILAAAGWVLDAVQSAVQYSGPKSSESLWGGTNQSSLSLACAVTSRSQKPVKGKRNPGTWRCCLPW